MKLGAPHVCFIQIGHYGDVINMLPVAWMLHKQGKIVHWFLEPPAKRDILRACSYVDIIDDIPIELEGERYIIRRMIAEVGQRYENIMICSHRDRCSQGEIICQSYNREGWRLAGFLHEFDGPVEYVIDRYKWPEERPSVRPIVVNLTSGQSSPFQYGVRLLQKLQAAFPDMIEDIGPLRLPSFLDLLPIIREASLFISIDTGTLWLSEFLPQVPTIAIVNHCEWSGSILHRKFESRISYREAQCDPRTVISAIERALRIKAEPGWEKVGEPLKVGNWPEVFVTGQINGESDMKLRYAAIRAWGEVLEGAEPCIFFDSVMRAISKRVGIPTDQLIEFTNYKKGPKIPNLP